MTSAPGSGGLLASTRALLATGVAVLQTRLELLITEVEEEKVRLGEILAYTLVALFFVGFGVILLALFLTVLLWDSHRLLALGTFCVLFLLVGLVAALIAVRRTRVGSRLFGASVAELARDRDALGDGR